MRLGFLGIATAVLTVGFFVRAQGAGKTVLDKVYTDAQADRGAAEYEAKCAHCHEGEEPDAPQPVGPEFIDHWREAPLSYLYTHISKGMPGNAPGSYSEATYLDVLAFLLRENQYPSGNDAELTVDKLDAILMVGPQGPRPLPGSAMVRVVGCLVPAQGGEWSLTSASAPVRVRDGDETTPEELAVSSSVLVGTASYRLRNAEDFKVEPLKGQRVQVKGTFTSPSVGVHSLERAGGACEK
jgi:mono/diheme cytochrome c family protein